MTVTQASAAALAQDALASAHDAAAATHLDTAAQQARIND